MSLFSKTKQYALKKYMELLSAHAPARALPEDVSKIAVLQFGGIGDLLITTGGLAALNKKFPDAKITLFTSSKGNAAILGRMDFLGEVVPFDIFSLDMRGLLKPGFWREFKKPLNALRAKNFDLLVNFHVPVLPNLIDWWAVEWTLVKLARARFSIGVRPLFFKTKSIYDVSVSEGLIDDLHFTQLYSRMLNNADIACAATTQLEVIDDSAAVKEVSPEKAVGAQYAVIHPGGFRASLENSVWSRENYQKLASLLSGECTVYLIGVESEAKAVEAIAAGNDNIISLAGKKGLFETADMIKNASVFIGENSGPFHIAAAMKTPCVIIQCRDGEPHYHDYPDLELKMFVTPGGSPLPEEIFNAAQGFLKG